MNAHDLFAAVAFLTVCMAVLSLVVAAFVWLIHRTDPR